MAWQQRAGHLRRDAELPAAPRCQRRSSPLPQAHERAVEKRKAEARESLMKDAQKLRAERTAARKEKLKQEKQLVAQLEQQLQAETEEMEVAWRGEGMGAARPRVGTWRTSAAGTGTHAFVCQVLRQEKQHLQEEREELELEGAW
eukprot:XP_025002206.1 uncharacterized protein LOC107050274 isoform X3 [Gallus gallus]